MTDMAETQERSEIEEIVQEAPELTATVLSVYVPDMGYLCRVTPPTQENAPYVITPIERIEEINNKTDPHIYAGKFAREELGAGALPIFREETQTLLLVDNNDVPKETTTNVFDVLLDEASLQGDIAKNESYVFVPKAVLTNNSHNVDSEGLIGTHRLTAGGRTIEAFVHPDCEKLVQESPQPLEITGTESATARRKIAKGVISAIEKIDHAYENGAPQDRLTLDHIEALRAIVPNKSLVDDLETAYIREKLVTMGFQQAAALAINAGIVETVLHNQDALTLLAIGGAVVNDAASKVAEGNTTPVSFRELLNKTLTEISNTYDLSKARIEGLEDPSAFAHNASVNLTEADALKSVAAAKWGSVAANSAVLMANSRFAEAGIYAGVGAATNIFGAVYKKKLQDIEKDKPTKQDNAPKSSQNKPVKELVVKGGGRLFQGGTSYATNVLAGTTGLSGQQLELAMHLVAFVTMNEAEQVSQSPEVVERRNDMRIMNELIKWAGERAGELATDDQYRKYCREKTVELSKEHSKTITLPNVDVLTHEPVKPVKHFPREVSISRGEKRYPIIERTLRAKHPDEEKIPNKAILFMDITGGYPGEKLLLRGTSLLAESGRVTELGGGVSTPMLLMLAERRKNSQGTTYIHTETSDTNVHLDESREDIKYYSCEDKKDYSFFEGQQPEVVMQKLKDSGLFDEEEINALVHILNTRKKVTGFSRATERKLALVESVDGDEAAVIINYPFNDLSEEDEVNAAKFLEKAAENKVVIIRADAARTAYKKYLAAQGTLESFEVKHGKISQSLPLPEQLVKGLEDLGYTWTPKIKRQMATELSEGIAKIEMVNGEPLRTAKVLRSNIYTTAPDGSRYKLKQDHKVEQSDDGEPGVKDRSQEEYSLYRSLRENDPEYTLKLRLHRMGVDTEKMITAPFEHTVEEKPSGTYPGLNAKYDFYSTDVEVPFNFYETHKQRVIAQHDSGGFTYFTWEKVG